MDKNLKRFDRDEIELVINTQTGESFATAKGYSRMSKVEYDTIKKRTQKALENGGVLKAEIPTECGLRWGTLIPGKLACQWLAKDNPELLAAMNEFGWNGYCHQLAGFQIKSTAIEPPASVSPIDMFKQMVAVFESQQSQIDALKLQQQQHSAAIAEIEKVRREAIEELKALPPATVEAAPLSTKAKLNRLVRQYATDKNLPFGYCWAGVYREFRALALARSLRDRYQIDLPVRGRNHKPKITGTEYADRYELIEQLYAVALEIFV